MNDVIMPTRAHTSGECAPGQNNVAAMSVQKGSYGYSSTLNSVASNVSQPVTNIPENGAQKHEMFDKAARRLEIIVLTAVVIFVAGLLSIPSVHYLVKEVSAVYTFAEAKNSRGFHSCITKCMYTPSIAL